MTTKPALSANDKEVANLAIEARVEAVYRSSSKERMRLARSLFARMVELLEESKWLDGVFSDLFADAQPRCGRECCEYVGGQCMESDQLANGDGVILAILTFVNFGEQLEEMLGERLLADLQNDELWEEDLVGRLEMAPKRPSPWVQRERRERAEVERAEVERAAEAKRQADEASRQADIGRSDVEQLAADLAELRARDAAAYEQAMHFIQRQCSLAAENAR